MNIIVGVIGAFLGGFIVSLFRGSSFTIGFDVMSFVVAIIGAIILLAMANLARR